MQDKVVGKSVSLRRAMCLAFNVEKYIDVLYSGRAKRAVNVIPSTLRGHKETGASPYAKYDLDQARKFLVKAKQELVAAGVIKPGQDIPEITLDVVDTDELSRKGAEIAQGQFKAVGLRVKIQTNDWATYRKKLRKKQFQMFPMGWQADYSDAENFLQIFYSPNIKGGANGMGYGANGTGYSSKEFDKLFEQAATITDEPKRIPLYAKMARRVANDCPVILLSEPVQFTLVHGWAHNYKPHPVAPGLDKYMRIDAAARRKAQNR